MINSTWSVDCPIDNHDENCSFCTGSGKVIVSKQSQSNNTKLTIDMLFFALWALGIVIIITGMLLTNYAYLIGGTVFYVVGTFRNITINATNNYSVINKGE